MAFTHLLVLAQGDGAITSYTPAVTDSIRLHLNATDVNSYNGTGTTWSDLSGNGYDFTVNESAFQETDGIKYMDFNATNGIAKHIVAGNLSDVPYNRYATFQVFSAITTDVSTGWRTLTRGTNFDHHVIINDSNIIGHYDNDSQGFISSGYNVTNVPNYSSKFNCLTFKLGQPNLDPEQGWKFRYNDQSSDDATISSVHAGFWNGISQLGGYGGGGNAIPDMNTHSQYWGKISVFLYYTRWLTDQEILDNYNAAKNYFSI